MLKKKAKILVIGTTDITKANPELESQHWSKPMLRRATSSPATTT